MTPRFYRNVFTGFCLISLSLASAKPLRAAPGAAFLKLGAGARASGLGQAYSAVADDAEAIYWNPAGLVRLGRKEVSFSHAELAGDSRSDSLAFALPFKKSVSGEPSDGAAADGTFAQSRWAAGISILNLSHGSLEGRDASGAKTGDFSASDSAASLSVAKSLRAGLGAGVTFKAIRQSIESETATGLALDAGLVQNAGRFTWAAAVQNAGAPLRFRSESYAMPFTLSLGSAFRVYRGLQASFDYRYGFADSASSLGFGAEISMLHFLSLRAGYADGFSSASRRGAGLSDANRFAGFGMGVGMRLRRFQLDYSVTPLGVLGLVQRASFSYRF